MAFLRDGGGTCERRVIGDMVYLARPCCVAFASLRSGSAFPNRPSFAKSERLIRVAATKSKLRGTSGPPRSLVTLTHDERERVR